MEQVTVTQLTDMVEVLIKERDYVTFAEIAELLEPHIDVGGNLAMALPGYENILLWAGMSEAFMDVIDNLHARHTTEMSSASCWTYLMDGKALSLPVAKSLRQYKKPRWLPVCLRMKEAAT